MSTTTVLPFAGGEMGSFDPLDASSIESTASAGLNYDAAYARCGFVVGSGSNGSRSPKWAEAADFWFHAKSVVNSNNTWFGTTNGLVFYEGSGGIVAELRFTQASPATSSRYELFTLQSAILTSVGFINLAEALQEIDINVKAGASGRAAFYSSGTLIFEMTGLDHTHFGGVAQILLGPGYSVGGAAVWSEVICDSVSHVGDRLWTFPINTNSGVNAQWTGSVSDIDEIVYDDATFIGAPSAALVSTFFANGFNLGTKNIVSVHTGSRAKRAATGPSALKNTIRVNGANASGPTIGLDVGFQACCTSWTTNPVLAGAWVSADAQTVEAGDTSVT